MRPNACRKFIEEILCKLGAPGEIAERWAVIQVETSLLGIDSHGIRMFDRYVKHIEGGGINVEAEPEVVTDKAACAAMDAKGGLGHISADRATQLALEKAKAHGASCVTARNVNHMGACAIYARQAAARDCIGLCLASSRSGIAPWGGKQALLGLNPIAVGAPVEGKHPFVIDMATTMVAMGKVTRAADLGEAIPDGWALDADGQPTTDPNAAIHGTLLPIGGHKGYGIAMAVEMLTSLLSGGVLAPEIKSWIQQTKDPMGAGFSMISIDIAVFQDPAAFKSRAREWTDLLTGSPRRDGVNRIYYPGEKEGECYDERIKTGIPIDERTRTAFEELAKRFDVRLPW